MMSFPRHSAGNEFVEINSFRLWEFAGAGLFAAQVDNKRLIVLFGLPLLLLMRRRRKEGAS